MTPKSAWSGRRCASSERTAQRCVRSRRVRDLARRRGVRRDRLVERDGDVRAERLLDGDRVLGGEAVVRAVEVARNVTPSSSITRRSASETTWKPPESVRIGPSQPMNRCSPPSRAIRSWPGRR